MNTKKRYAEKERQQFQAKIYTTWLNSKLSQAPGSPKILDIFQDLTDGKFLLQLLEVLLNKRLKPVKGNLRLHHLNNLTLVLDTLQQQKVKLIGISNQSINDGEKVPTLGLCWSIIYKYQVLEAIKGDGKAGDAEKALLKWIGNSIAGYVGQTVSSFNVRQWRDGLTFCTLLHTYNQEMFKYTDQLKKDDSDRWQFGIDMAHNNYDVQPLFSVEDLDNDAVDSRTLVLYISSVYEKLKDKTPSNKMQEEEEEIQAVEAAVDESSMLVIDNLHSLIKTRCDQIEKINHSSAFTQIANPTLKELEKKHSELLDIEKSVDEMSVIDIKSELDMALSVNSVPPADEELLKEELKNLEGNYNQLKEKVQSDVTRVHALKTEQANQIKLQEKNWLSKLEQIHDWVNTTTKEFSAKNKNITEEQDVIIRVNEIMKAKIDLETNWNIYQELGHEWNNELCDKLQSELYADMLSDVKDDFNMLNKVLAEQKSKYNKLNKELVDAKILNSWKKQYNSKMEDALAFKQNIPPAPTEVDLDSALQWKVDLQKADNKLSNCKLTLNDLLVEKKNILDNNKVSSKIKKIMNDDIEHMKVSLDDNKQVLDECKLRALKMNEVLCAKENSLYKQWFDKYIETNQRIVELVNITNGMSENDASIEKLELHISNVDKYKTTIAEVSNYGKELSTGTDISNEKKTNVKTDCNILANSSRKLEDSMEIFQTNLKTKQSKEEQINSAALSDWEDKSDTCKQILDNAETNEILMSKIPSNLKEFKKYKINVDNAVSTFVKDSEIIHENLEFGQNLINSGKIKDRTKLDQIRLQLSEYNARKNTLYDRHRELQQKLEEEDGELSSVEQDKYNKWHDKYTSANDLMNEQNKNADVLLNSDDANEKKLHNHLQEMVDNEETIQEVIDYGTQLANNDVFGEEKDEKFSCDMNQLNKNFKLFKSSSQCLEKRLTDLNTSSMNAWNDRLLELKNTVKKQMVALNDIDMDNIDEAIVEIKVLSAEIKIKEDLVESFENESESLLSDDKQLDDKSKLVVQDGYRTFTQDWSSLKERLELLDNKCQTKKIEEDGITNKSISEWNRKAEKVEEWLRESENEPILQAELPTNFKNYQQYKQGLQTAIFKFTTEEKVIDGNLEFGQYLVDSGKIKDQELLHKVKSQLSDYALREDNIHNKLKELQKGLEKLNDGFMIHENDIYESWLSKYTVTNENMVVTIEEFNELLNNQVETPTLAEIHELITEINDQINEVQEVIVFGEKLSTNDDLSELKKLQISSDQRMLEENLSSLRNSSKLLQDRFTDIQKSCYDDWCNSISPLQTFVKDKTSDLNQVDMSGEINDAMNQIQVISDEIAAKEDLVEAFENESESLLSDDKQLDDKSKVLVQDGYRAFMGDWSSLKERSEVMNNRLLKKKLEEEGVSTEALNEWKEKAANIESWLYESENDPILLADVPTNLSQLNLYEQALKNLSFKLKIEEKVIDEKLEFGKSLLKTGKIKDAASTSELKEQIDSYIQRKKELIKCLSNMEQRCGNISIKLSEDAQTVYKEWCNEFNDANDVLVDKKQHSINYGEYLKNNDVTKPVQEEIINHLDIAYEYEEPVSQLLLKGTQLVNSDDLPSDVHANVKQQCEVLHENLRQMKTANKSLEEKLDSLKVEGVKDWNEKLGSLQAFIRSKSVNMNNIDINRETDVSIQAIEKVADDIKEKEADVKDVQLKSEDLLAPSYMLDDKTQASIKSNLSTFIEDWNSMKDRKNVIELSLQSKRSEDLELSDHAIKDWKEKSIKISTWLDESENNPLLLSEFPTELPALEKFSTDLENLIFKLTTEDKIIGEQVDFGTTLSNSGKIKNGKQLETLKKEISEFTRRKTELNENLLKIDSRISSLLANAHDLESNEYKAWMDAAEVGKQHLAQFEETGKEVVVKTSKEAEVVIDKQKEFLKELDEYEHQIDNLTEAGYDLIDEKKLGERKSQEIKSEAKLIEQRWKALKSKGSFLLERYEGISTMLNSESDEKADSLLTRIQLFNEWLQLGQQQLDFYKNCEKPVQFDELIHREQGLKKLSSDLDSRAKEFNDLQRASNLIKTSDETLSGKSTHVVQNMEDLQQQWSDIIDTIDAELKNLYDMINSSLDKKRGGIDKSLKSIDSRLNSIIEAELNKETLISCVKELSEVTTELNKFSSPMKKLGSQTVAVGDVTLFKDEEKDLMKQSFDELYAQYKNCQQLSEKAKQRLKNSIHGYFKEHCDSCNENIKTLNQHQVNINEDEEDLVVLKDYLQGDQEVLDSAELELSQLDELEHFAEEVSTLGLLDADDQVKVAHIINESLKNVEQLRQDCKSKMNRVYAVILHSLKVSQQNANQSLQKIGKEVDVLTSDGKTVQIFNDAVVMLKATKRLEEDFKETVNDINKIKSDTEALSKANVLAHADIEKLQARNACLLNESIESSEALGIHNKNLTKDLREVTTKKLDEFWGWLPIMQKRSKESNEIGPDLLTLKNQLQEMQVISFQTQEKSFEIILTEENEELLKKLPETQQKEVKSAEEDCKSIIDWQNNRIKGLERATSLWEEFNHNENDLLEYLRNNNKEEKVWLQLDLNDEDNVNNSKSSFDEIMKGLEIRKPHVRKLEGIGDDLLEFLANEGPVANNLKSRIADIHDAWNKTVKKSIENSSKLRKSREKLQKLELSVSDIRNWINETNTVVNDFNVNKNDERVEKLRELIEIQNVEKSDLNDLLDSVNDWNDDLNNDEVIRSHFSIDDDVTALNYDFHDAIKMLEYFDTFRGKGYVFWRRVKQTMSDGASRTKKTFEKTEDEEDKEEKLQIESADQSQQQQQQKDEEQQQCVEIENKN